MAETTIDGRCPSCGAYMQPTATSGLAVCSRSLYGECDSGKLLSVPGAACRIQYAMQTLKRAEHRRGKGLYIDGKRFRKVGQRLSQVEVGAPPTNLGGGRVFAVCGDTNPKVYEMEPVA